MLFDGSQTGLLKASAIKCENLATVETRLIRRKIGVAPRGIMSEVDVALKEALAVS